MGEEGNRTPCGCQKDFVLFLLTLFYICMNIHIYTHTYLFNYICELCHLRIYKNKKAETDVNMMQGKVGICYIPFLKPKKDC